MSVEAADIYKHEQENGVAVGYKLPERKSDAYFRLFKVLLDDSLDSMELEKSYKRICRKKFSFSDKYGNAYTLAVVNVKFNYIYKQQQKLKAIQERAKANKILWHGFISLNEEMSRKIDMPEKCMRLVKRTFGEFFRDMGLDPKNIDLICSLHKDKPHHLHIHFWFAEKEPKCKYRKKALEYRHKGKIEKAVIDRMHVRLNAFIDERTDKLYIARNEALRELKRITFPKSIVSEDEVRKELIALAKAIPKDASFFYNKKDMVPYREQIDKTVNKLLLYDKRARKADLHFYERLSSLQRKIGDLYESSKSGNHYPIAPQNITLIQELEEDYKRRQGNIVLHAVKNIKPEIYERKFRHKVNDNSLKRKLAIKYCAAFLIWLAKTYIFFLR